MDKSLSAPESACQNTLLIPRRTISWTKLTQANVCALIKIVCQFWQLCLCETFGHWDLNQAACPSLLLVWFKLMPRMHPKKKMNTKNNSNNIEILDRVKNYDIFCFLKRRYSPITEKGDHQPTKNRHLTRKRDPKMTAVGWKVTVCALHIHLSFLAWRSAMIMAARRGNWLDGWSCFNLRVVDLCDLVRRCPRSGWLTRLPTGMAHSRERDSVPSCSRDWC